MEILTILILVGGGLFGLNWILKTFQQGQKEQTERFQATAHDITQAFLHVQKEIFPPVTKLLSAMSARLDPEILKTSSEPMPAALVTWIHTWPDQWHIDQQISFAQELYKQYGNWEQVQTALLQEAKRSELDDDGILI